MKMKKNYYIILILLIIGIVLTYLYSEYRDSNHSISINSNIVTFGSGQDAFQKLKEINDNMLSKQVMLKYKGISYKYNYKELGFKTDYQTISNKILSAGSIKKNLLRNCLNFLHKSEAYNIKYVSDITTLKTKLSAMDPELLQKPSDAHFEVIGDNLNIVDEKKGEDIDYKALASNLENCTANEVSVPFIYNKPTITAAKLRSYGITDLVSEFTTSFSGSSLERITNITLATKSISNTLLAPNQIFSYNSTIGEVTIERGYKIGHIYVNGQVVDGVGGGICQVSTTLYNAVLYANLEVVERHNHQLPVSYVSLSKDATVSHGSKDFRFKNSSKSYIYLYTEIKGKNITVKIFGKKTDISIKLTSKLLETIQPPVNIIKDSSLNQGVRLTVKHGMYGKKSQLIKSIYENGNLIKTEVVSTDIYTATPSTIKVGTEKTKSEQPTTSTLEDQNTEIQSDNSKEGSDTSEPIQTN